MTLALLWAWATLAGLDLVSVLQMLFSRPLVVGAGAGILLGDPVAGLRVGALIELFALDVVPVGSARYPDFGAATAAGVLLAAGRDWQVALGGAGLVVLLLAMAAGMSLPLTRRWNARIVRAMAGPLASGAPAALRSAHWRCLGNDAIRSGVVAALAIGVGWAVLRAGLFAGEELGRLLTVIAVAGGVWAVVHGAVASARSGHRWRWALGGLALGLLGVGWR